MIRESETFIKALSGEAPLRRSVPLVQQETLGDREAVFIMTDSAPDREGDIIFSAGVETKQFEEFGSILWGHRADLPEFVLGAPKEVLREPDRLLVRAEFLEADANPSADRVLRMIKAGAVKAMSVGVIIREFKEAQREGFRPLDIFKSELIETSVTPVPMNPRAVLIAANGSEVEANEIADMFEEATDTKEQLEASSLVTGLSEGEIKALVHSTLNELLGEKTFSLPQPAAPDVPETALDYFARLAAQ